jgi:hypothetical protein
VSSPLPLASFPLTLLSDRLTLAEFFHFNKKTGAIQAEHGVKRRLDIQAYAVESPEIWNTPIESAAEDRGNQVPERLLLVAVAPAMRDLLFEVGMTCGRRKNAHHSEADVRDEVGLIGAIFDKLRQEGVPLARMPEDVPLRGFFEQADRCCNARVGAPVFLNVQLYALLPGSAPIPHDRPPKRLIVATNDPTLRSALHDTATSVGAPRRPEDLNGLAPSDNHGQPGFFSGLFGDMETNGLTALASTFQSEVNGAFEDRGMFVLARTSQTVASLLQKLGIGGVEPFDYETAPPTAQPW